MKLSNGQPIDLSALLQTRLLIQANSGGGKSWCLRRILEQSHGKVQQFVIDPEGEFATLREKYDYVLAAKQGGEAAADPRIAKLLAERLLELGTSAILDIYELKATERLRFVRGFLEALVDAPKRLWHPLLVVLDEAHVYCPQQGNAESASAVIDLATRGRKRGFCAVLATQRLSKLHKDAAAECNNKLIGRTGLDVDVKRACDELGFGKERWRDLRRLAAGHFYAFGPAISAEVVEVHVGPVKTTHPKADGRIAATAPPPTRKIKALLSKLADIPKEAERRQKTIEDLKGEVRSLRAQLTAAQRDRDKKQPPEVIYTEVPLLSKKDLARMDRVGTSAAELVETLRALAEKHGLQIDELTRQAAPPRKPETHTVAAPPPMRTPTPPPAANGDGSVSRSQQRILDALAWLEALGLSPAEKTQVALLSDQSPTSGGYFNNLGRLRSNGAVDYPKPGSVALTDHGRSLADTSAAPQTSEEMHEQLFRRLSGSQAAILRELIARYPEDVDKSELADQVGQSRTSGGYFNNLGRLRSLRLIDYPQRGRVVAQSILFFDQH